MENTSFDINKEDVLGVMDYNKVDAVLVTSGGAVYLTTAKNVCASECARLQQEWREVTRKELSSLSLVPQDQQPNDKPLEDLKVDELKALAAKEGIELTTTKKNEIIAEIREKQGTQLTGPEGDKDSTNAGTDTPAGDQAKGTDEPTGGTATNPAE